MSARVLSAWLASEERGAGSTKCVGKLLVDDCGEKSNVARPSQSNLSVVSGDRRMGPIYAIPQWGWLGRGERIRLLRIAAL